MMRSKILALLVASTALLPLPAHSQPPAAPVGALEGLESAPPDIPPGTDRIASLATGDRAPFGGQLLDTDTAIRWLNRLRWFRFELRLVTQQNAESQRLMAQSHDAQMRIVEESYRREIEGLRTDLRSQATAFAAERSRLTRPTPWFRTSTFGFVLGVVVTTGIVITAKVTN